MARRYIGDAVIEIKYRDTGDYAGTVSAGGHTWRFADLNAPKAGLGAGVAYDSPEAYDVMAASAVSFGSYYTTHNRGDAPEWAPSAEVADAIDEAVSGVMDDKGRYEVQRTWGGKISVRNELKRYGQGRETGGVVSYSVSEYTRHKKAVEDAVASFSGKTFGLRSHPGRIFRVSKDASYWSERDGVMLYVEVLQKDGTWADFAKGVPEEVRREMAPLSRENSSEAPIFEITLVGKAEHLRSFVHDLMATREWDGDPIKWRDRVYVLKSEPGFKRETLKLMARTSTKTNLVYALKSTPGVGSVEYDVQKIDTMPNGGHVPGSAVWGSRCGHTWKVGKRVFMCTLRKGHDWKHQDNQCEGVVDEDAAIPNKMKYHCYVMISLERPSRESAMTGAKSIASVFGRDVVDPPDVHVAGSTYFGRVNVECLGANASVCAEAVRARLASVLGEAMARSVKFAVLDA